MSLRALAGVLALLVAVQAAAQVYRWVDEDGVIHYSDQPVEGAELIELPNDTATPGSNAPRTPRTTTNRGDEAGDESSDEFAYRSLTVATPSEEQTLWNIQGTLNVSLSLQPSLQEGHRVRVYLDGESRLVDAVQFELTEVWRGTHTLQAEVLDSTGRLMIRSDPRRFFVQQTSVLN